MKEEKDDKKYTTISIPTPLAEKIKKRIEGTGFHSLSSFVIYLVINLPPCGRGILFTSV